jgi:hypothetical protein
VPTLSERKLAKLPHDIFLSNLIMNHILLFSAFATMGPKYINLLMLIPVFSLIAIGYTLHRASTVKRENSEFAYIHWQIAARWSKLLAAMLLLLVSVTAIAWLGHKHLGFMREMSYALAAGLGLLPTMVSVLVLVVIESDSLNHARIGTLPKWAKQRFLEEAL